jgi:hypothetical protein
MRKGGVLRPRPSDFWTTYVEVGRVGCIEHYRTHRTVVERWADEVGKVELRKARADYVAEQKQRAKPQEREVCHVAAQDFDPDECSAACQYLRENRNGGWRVGAREDGRYFVGTAVMGGAEVIERAKSKGMDEWYVEADMFKRLDMHVGVDEWVLEKEVV